MNTTVIKISGGYLRGEKSPFCFTKYLDIAKTLRTAARKGRCLAVVMGGGNIVRGKEFADFDKDASDLCVDYAGMLGSVQNAFILRRVLRRLGSDAEIIVPEQFVIPETVHFPESPDHPGIYLLGGGIGEPGFSTDTGTIINAIRCGADEIVFLKDKVDGLYDDDPRKNPAAKFVGKITYTEYCARGLTAIDTNAVQRLVGTGIRTYITGCSAPNLYYLLSHSPVEEYNGDREIPPYSILTD